MYNGMATPVKQFYTEASSSIVPHVSCLLRYKNYCLIFYILLQDEISQYSPENCLPEDIVFCG